MEHRLRHPAGRAVSIGLGAQRRRCSSSANARTASPEYKAATLGLKAEDDPEEFSGLRLVE
jgi:hypothetical protein